MMESIINAVKGNRMGLKKASKKFNMSKTILVYFVKNKNKIVLFWETYLQVAAPNSVINGFTCTSNGYSIQSEGNQKEEELNSSADYQS